MQSSRHALLPSLTLLAKHDRDHCRSSDGAPPGELHAGCSATALLCSLASRQSRAQPTDHAGRRSKLLAARRVDAKRLVRRWTVAALDDVVRSAREERLDRRSSHPTGRGGLSTAPLRWGFGVCVSQGVRGWWRRSEHIMQVQQPKLCSLYGALPLGLLIAACSCRSSDLSLSHHLVIVRAQIFLRGAHSGRSSRLLLGGRDLL